MGKSLKLRLAAIPAAVAAAGSANAALPTGIDTAVQSAATDIGAAVVIVITAMVVVWGLMKLGRKLGWL